jgi:hypothetical protein
MSGVSASDSFSTATVEYESKPTFDASKIGKYTITYTATDAAGNPTVNTRVITITDGEKPSAELSYSTTDLTNQDVVVKIVADEDLAPLAGWTKIDARTYTKAFAANQTGQQEICDLNTNCTTLDFVIENIDKVQPKLTVSYSTTDPTTGDVVVIVTSDKLLNEKELPDGFTKVGDNTYQKVFAANATETVVFTDAAGNEASAKIAIDWIDKSSRDQSTQNDSKDANDSPGQPDTGFMAFARNPLVVGATGLATAGAVWFGTRRRVRQ